MTTARQSRFDSGPHHWHGAQPHRPPVSADGAGFPRRLSYQPETPRSYAGGNSFRSLP